MLYIIRGLPGSGKTTKAQCLLRDGVIDVYYEQDMYRITDDGRYSYRADDNHRCRAKVYNAVSRALAAGLNVAVCNTFIKHEYMLPFKTLARLHGGYWAVMTCTAKYGSVHNVPKSVLDDMARGWEP